MTLTTYPELEQGTDEWLAARCGIVTASVVHNLVSSRQPTAIDADCPECGSAAAEPCVGKRSPGPLKTLHTERAAAAREMPRRITADTTSETALGLIMALAAERITGHVVPIQPSRAMERGTLDEPYARDHYAERHAPVQEIGFMVKHFDGYSIGYSPDGLVGDKGLIEIKSREQKTQLKTVLAGEPPAENIAQMMCGLLVTGRAWCDYVSWSGGMPAWVHRVYPDTRWFDAIKQAVAAAETQIAEIVSTYLTATKDLPPTERVDHFAEMEIY